MALEFKGVRKQFDNSEKPTLSGIDLEVKDGEFVCIVGTSGCGKSTLLNLAAGLERPSEGKIVLDGEEVTGPGADRTVMFQEHGLFPWLNVIENVKFGMKLSGVPAQEQEKKAMYYLDMVHLTEYRDYPIHQISGGMRQRTALARALTMDARVLLMEKHPLDDLKNDEITKEREK